MEHSIAKRVVAYMLNNNIIASDYCEVYIYGIELILSFIISTSIIMLIGMALGQLIQTLTFLVVFVGLRRFTGGYHANSYFICKMFTIGTYLIVLLLSNISNIDIPQIAIITILGLLIIIIWGPIENPNKPLTLNEKKRNKIIALLLYPICIFIGFLVSHYSQPLSNVICYTLTSIIALMIISILKKGASKNEEMSC